jgi:hypothetical protein
MRGNPRKSGGSRPSQARLAASLGAGVPGEIIPSPLALQSQRTLFFRGVDGIGVKGSAWGFGVDSAPLTNASSTQTLANWLTACSNCTGAASVYEQFRPLRLRIRAIPSTNLLTAGAPYVLAFDPTADAPVAPTLAQVAAYRTSKIFTAAEPWEIVFALPLPAAGAWYDSISPTDWLGQLLTQPSAALPTSVNFLAYSNLLFEFEILMRGIGP